MRVVLASKNKHKLVEISKITQLFDMELVLQSELGVDIDVEETVPPLRRIPTLRQKPLWRPPACLPWQTIPVSQWMH